MKIKEIKDTFTNSTISNIEGTNIYIYEQVINNATSSVIKIARKNTDGTYDTLMSFSLIYIFCTMTILRDLCFYKNTSTYDEKFMKYFDYIVLFYARQRNVMSFQNTSSSTQYIEFLDKSQVFINTSFHNSHYGLKRQKVYLADTIKIPTKYYNSSEDVINENYNRTKQDRMLSYFKNNIVSIKKDNAVPFNKKYISDKIKPGTGKNNSFYEGFRVAKEAMMNLLNDVETANGEPNTGL